MNINCGDIPKLDAKLQATLERMRGKPLELIIPSQLACDAQENRLVEKPLVSIVVITYKHEPFIAQTLHSLLSQITDFPFEIVVGEDRSPDDTMAVIRNIQESNPGRIRLVTSARNVGASVNALRVLSACEGAFIAFCEGDDFWTDETKLKEQVDVFNRNPKVVMCFTSGRVLCQEQNLVVEKPDYGLLAPGPQAGDEFRRLIMDVGFSPLSCSVMVRADALERAYRTNPLFWIKLSLGDTLLFLEMSRQGTVWYVPKEMVAYRIHAGGVTQGERRLSVKLDATVVYYYFSLQFGRTHKLLEIVRNALQIRLNQAYASRRQGLLFSLLRQQARYGFVSYPKAVVLFVLGVLGLKTTATKLKAGLVSWVTKGFKRT